MTAVASATLVRIELDPAVMRADQGACWHVPAAAAGLPPGDDLEWRRRSSLRLYEDGRVLGPGHSVLHAIRGRGAGRYSHWSDGLNFSTSDNSDPRTNGRVYSVTVQPEPAPDSTLAALAAGYAANDPAACRAMVEYLASGTPDARAERFHRLGLALAELGRRDLTAAKFFQVWRVGRRRFDLWHPALAWAKAHLGDDDLDGFLRSGAAAAAAAADADWMVEVVKEHEAACFRAYLRRRCLPFQDDGIFDPASRLLPRWGPALPLRRTPGPLRVGYLLSGEYEDRYCSLPEICAELAIAHDRKTVAASLISLYRRDEVVKVNPFLPAMLERLEAAARPVHFLDRRAAWANFHELRAAAEDIAALDLDVLVLISVAGVHGVLALLRPARHIVSIGLGETHLYTSPAIDLTAHVALKPAADGLSAASAVVPLFIPPGRVSQPLPAVPRDALGLPADSLVVLSSARPVKYDEADYWWIVSRLLEGRPMVRLAALGLDPATGDALMHKHGLDPVLRPRVHPLGWRNDHARVVAAADIYLDTFPNANGYAVLETLNVGVPAVVFEEDPLLPFAERTWSHLAEEFTDYPALAHGNRESVLERLLALLDDPELRRQAVAIGRRHVAAISQPRRTAAALEELLRMLAARTPATRGAE